MEPPIAGPNDWILPERNGLAKANLSAVALGNGLTDT
jgi:hypothetical protein